MFSFISIDWKKLSRFIAVYTPKIVYRQLGCLYFICLALIHRRISSPVGLPANHIRLPRWTRGSRIESNSSQLVTTVSHFSIVWVMGWPGISGRSLVLLMIQYTYLIYLKSEEKPPAPTIRLLYLDIYGCHVCIALQ